MAAECAHTFIIVCQLQDMMDAGAINFFVNSITNQSQSQQQQQPSHLPPNNGIPQHILAQHMAMNNKEGFVPAMNMNGMLNGNTQMSLNLFAPEGQQQAQQQQQFHPAQQSAGPFGYGVFDQQQQQSQMLQSHPPQPQQMLANESRKRSAPTQSTSNGAMFDQHHGMPSTSQVATVLAALALGSVEAAMGPAFSTGPVSDNSWIREATSTLVLPQAPSGNSGDASLWVGMGTSNGDLIQSIADNWQSDSWSVYAYTLTKTGGSFNAACIHDSLQMLTRFIDNSQLPVQGPSSDATAGQRVTMHCK